MPVHIVNLGDGVVKEGEVVDITTSIPFPDNPILGMVDLTLVDIPEGIYAIEFL